jgi:putative hydrolase of HD superfamily
LRERIEVRFREPNLHAKLIKRVVMGQVVIDHEEVTRTFPEGTGKLELVAIYEVREGRIATARFISGAKTLDPKP